MRSRSALTLVLLLAGAGRVSAQAAPNVVTQWATIVQQSIHNASAPRPSPSAQVLHTTAALAMYDAAIAIEGGFEPYAGKIQAPAGADVRAAVATAAYLTARARVAASQRTFLDQQYAAYLLTIADGPAKTDGIHVGESAAEAILQLREDDGFANVVLYECSSVPPPVGEFEPDGGCPTGPNSPQPVDAKVGWIKPYSFKDASRYRPDGPSPIASGAYTRDFEETRDYGRTDSWVRSAEQTDIAYFWAEHAYAHWNRNLVNLAVARALTVRDAARFFAMVHTAAGDAVIAGFEAKYHYRHWRPRTAIPRADTDDNPATAADPSWRPLLMVNHPEYPSGHGFWSAAVLEAVKSFFGSKHVTWTIATSRTAVPQLVQTERTYDDLNVLMREIADARVWGGLHWRQSVRDGARLGRRVARHVTKHFFRSTK